MRLHLRRLAAVVWLIAVVSLLQPLMPWPLPVRSAFDWRASQTTTQPGGIAAQGCSEGGPADAPSVCTTPVPASELVAASALSGVPATAPTIAPAEATQTATATPVPTAAPQSPVASPPVTSPPVTSPPALAAAPPTLTPQTVPPPAPTPAVASNALAAETPTPEPPPQSPVPARTQPVPPPPPVTLEQQFSEAILAAINGARIASGRAAFTRNESLRVASDRYARLLLAHGTLDHYLDGTPWERGQREGYPSGIIGEVLALYGTSESLNPAEHSALILAGWMNSPGHRDVIMSKDFAFSEVGVGCAIGTDTLGRNVVICAALAGQP